MLVDGGLGYSVCNAFKQSQQTNCCDMFQVSQSISKTQRDVAAPGCVLLVDCDTRCLAAQGSILVVC